MFRTFLKNVQLSTILNTPGHVALDRIDVWFQDEARFGQQNTMPRIWPTKGTRPLFGQNGIKRSASWYYAMALDFTKYVIIISENY